MNKREICERLIGIYADFVVCQTQTEAKMRRTISTIDRELLNIILDLAAPEMEAGEMEKKEKSE